MISIHDISIDDELDALLPELSDSERLELAKSIANEGFREPLIVWLNHGVLVDGHNRYRIWKQFHEGEQDRTPEIVEKAFKDRDAVCEWMLRNQLARRNLTDAHRAKVTLLLKPYLEAKAKANMAAGGAKPKKAKEGLANLPTLTDTIDVREELAQLSGVSARNIAKVEKVLAEGTEEVKAKMLAPKSAPKDDRLSIDAAYKATVKPTPNPVPLSKAMVHAHDAINILRKISLRDPQRLMAFQEVSKWIKANKSLEGRS